MSGHSVLANPAVFHPDHFSSLKYSLIYFRRGRLSNGLTSCLTLTIDVFYHNSLETKALPKWHFRYLSHPVAPNSNRKNPLMPLLSQIPVGFGKVQIQGVIPCISLSVQLTSEHSLQSGC